MGRSHGARRRGVWLVMPIVIGQSVCVAFLYEWRGAFANAEVEALHAQGFDHGVRELDWKVQLDRHSLGWVSARHDRELVGFVNVAWDGQAHAFILDTVVAPSYQRSDVGTELVSVAVRGTRAAGCEWLHVDFEHFLRPFYLGSCGFTPTRAGLLRLKDN